MTSPRDPVALTRSLIRCRSVTPKDDGAIGVVEGALAELGFTCHRLRFEGPGTEPVLNLYARLGGEGPNLCFAGHVDVVPPGDPAAWRFDPFAAELVDGVIHGRGAVDMKGAIACFIAAAARLLEEARPEGSISLLITGDEEGPAINGTRKVLTWLEERGEVLDACIIGEPTNPDRIGGMVKIGRRGSLSGRLVVKGVQGHTAYPDQADNPVHRLIGILEMLLAEPLDHGSAFFEPSRLQVTTIDVGNGATNVIPGEARAAFNIRFNDHFTARSLEVWLRERLERSGATFELETTSSGDSFVTLPGPLTEVLESVIEDELGVVPELSTSGGTSDARFLKDICPVVEFGLSNATIHKVDEQVSVEDLEALTRVYHAFLGRHLGHHA